VHSATSTAASLRLGLLRNWTLALSCRLQSNSAINGDEEACEVFIALVGVPVIGLRFSALGETRSVKERPRTRPSRLCASGSATSARWNDGPTAIRSVHECTRLEITAVNDRPNYSRMMRRGGEKLR